MASKLGQRVIAEAALAAIDADGVEALSMRRIAQDLGSSAMSLYTYFPDKNSLLDGVTQLLLAEVEAPPEDAHWRDAMRHIMRAVRLVGLRHKNAAVLIRRFPPHTPDALVFVEAGFRAFRRAGFDALSTARCYRALAAYSLGTIDIELGGYFTAESRVITGNAREDIGSASSDRLLPLVTEIGPTLNEQDDAAEFEYGLELLLDGFADAMARAGRTV
ncbi:regulatory protein, tetR family [Paramicrobacterium humi]|uniref:Regulatory protein, tetR family n=2 Tax=Paramicrobacterium humi TaxID=640635 RepID=A0A1H4NV66_9MICO|nr:regulatory protein, tetR family [Microbacterium humi]